MAADLRYEDVQRAAQAAIQNMQNNLVDVRNRIMNMQQQTDLIDDHMYRLDKLDNQLNKLTQTVNQLLTTLQMTNQQLQNVQSIPRQLEDLQSRLGAVERFSNDMSDYLRQKQEQEEDNQGFRSAG